MAKYNGSAAKVAGIEKIILSVLGVEADYITEYDRLQIRADDRVQSRIDKNNAPTHMVDRYANQMGEFTFPPIIVTADHIIVDGNTRNKARGKRNERYIEALVIPIHWDSADNETRTKLLYLSELINNMNGLPLGDEEREKMVATMIAQGAVDEEIVTKVGMALKDVTALRERHKAAVRLERLGIEPDSMPKSVMRGFGGGTVMHLGDESYRAVAELTKEAGLKTNEVKALAASLNDVGSDEMRRERLARERTAREPEITARASGQATASLAGQLRGRLKIVLDNPLTTFVERNPEKVHEHLELLSKVQDLLGQIIALHPAVPAATVAAQHEARPH